MKPIMIWQCLECKSIQFSNSFEHHQMDSCKCGKSAIDLETYGCRFLGSSKILKKLDGYFDELVICLREQGFTEFFVDMESKIWITLEGVMFVRELQKEIIEDYIKNTW